MRELPEWQKVLALGLSVAAVGGLLLAFGGQLLDSAAGVDVELLTQLKNTERHGFSQPLAGSSLVGNRLSYHHLTVTHEGPGRAVVTATLDFTGRFGETKVSSLGLERVVFERHDRAWKPTLGWAPRLGAIVTALDHRRMALRAGDPHPDELDAELIRSLRDRSFEVEAWYIRSEREGIEVAEDAHLAGQTPERPVDQRLTRRLELVEQHDGGFALGWRPRQR